MRKKFTTIVCLLIIGVLLSSCTREYTPNEWAAIKAVGNQYTNVKTIYDEKDSTLIKIINEDVEFFVELKDRGQGFKEPRILNIN